MPDQRPITGNPAAPIRTPDQLQQARRPDRPAAAPKPELRDAAPVGGVLGQLAAERGHD